MEPEILRDFMMGFILGAGVTCLMLVLIATISGDD